MTKNPLINALCAFLYIILIASIMFYGSKYSPPTNSVIAPIALVSLFTLSAAVMGYIFLYQPFLLYFDNKKKMAINLFLKTVAFFGLITSVILFLLFSGILSLF